MVFCRGCGKEIHDSAPMCPHCGAVQQAISQTSTKGWGNSMAWAIAFTPLIGAFAEGLVSGALHYDGAWLVIVTIAINVFMCDKDYKMLVADGVDVKDIGATWFVPTYLFKRAKVLNENIGYPITWCVMLAILILSGN
jgi:hypothetical protein